MRLYNGFYFIVSILFEQSTKNIPIYATDLSNLEEVLKVLGVPDKLKQEVRSLINSEYIVILPYSRTNFEAKCECYIVMNSQAREQVYLFRKYGGEWVVIIIGFLLFYG